MRTHIAALKFIFLFLGICFAFQALAQSQSRPLAFDIVRVGPDGFAVMAGRGPSNAEIAIFDGDKLVSKAKSNEQGEWAIITDTPLAVGDRKLRLQAKLADGKTVAADQVLVVAVPKRGGAAGAGGATMALLLSKRPGGISRLLQKPEPEKGLSQVELGLNQLSYSKKSPLKLQGSGRPGASIRIYVENKFIGAAKAGENGAWRYTFKKPAGKGRRRLRLDQIDAGGKVDARIEVGFGDEAVRTAAVPALTKSANKSGKRSEKTVSGKKSAKNKQQLAAKKNDTKDANGKSKEGFVVRRGHNLWRIAQKIYGEGTKYTVIFRANKGNIRDPNKIYPGQVLKLPK